MDIAAASVVMSQAKLKQDVGVSLMGQVKDQANVDAKGLMKMLESSSVQHPNLGHHLDVKA